MTETLTASRHRAAVRPKTPLTALTEAVADNVGQVGRRTAIVAVSSGLLMGFAAPAAQAAPADGDTVAGIDTTQVAEAAKQALQSVSIPADAEVTYTGAAIQAIAPAPKVEKKATAASTASRSGTRTAKAAATNYATDAPAPQQSISGSAVAEVASRYVGTPYVSGGSAPGGFDCSGFVKYVYAQFGVSLPHKASAMRNIGTRVSAAEAKPGDLVVFTSHSHVGIYAGNGMMYDAAKPGVPLQFRSIYSSSIVYQRVL